MRTGKFVWEQSEGEWKPMLLNNYFYVLDCDYDGWLV